MVPEKVVPELADAIRGSRTVPNPALDGNALLTVSPFEEDLAALRRIFNHSRWKVYQCRNCSEALALLHQAIVSIVISDRAVPGGGWKRLAHDLRRLAPAPKLIVTHRFSEADATGQILKEGAYHVIVKPFSKSEVFQAVGFAWQQWKREQAKGGGSAAGRMAAGA